MAESSKMDFSMELARGVQVHSKLSQEVLVTTSDKLRLCLIKHRSKLSSRTDFIAPLGILLTLVTTLVVSSFDSPVWQAVFMLGSLLAAIWLGYAVWGSLPNIRDGFTSGADRSIDQIVDELRVKTAEVTSGFRGLFNENAD